MLIGASILWSTGGIFTKSIEWNSFMIIAVRGVIAAVVMLPFLGGKPQPPKNFHQMMGVLSYAFLILCCITATKLTTSANAILLQYTAPIYTAFLGWKLLGEKITRRDWIAIAFMLLGMVCFLYDGLGAGNMLGNLIAALSGVCYAAMAVFMKIGDQKQPMQNVFWGTLLASILAAPFAKGDLTSGLDWVMIAAMAVFQLAFAYILYANAVHRVAALEITVVTMLEPILNPVWVLLLNGEKPGIMALVGGAIVLVTVVVQEAGKIRAEEKAAARETARNS